MKTAPQVNCPHCFGLGKIALPSEYQRTLSRITQLGSATTEYLQEKGVSHSAICQRLKRMEDMGLIERDGKESKRVLWKPVVTEKGAARE